MNIGQRVKLVKIHHMMNPILKEKLGQKGEVIHIGKELGFRRVVVKFDKTDVNYGEWWVGERYLEEIGMSRLEELLEILALMRRWHHYECEDGFYSCPAHPRYFGNDDSGKCNCGMEEDNANIDAAIRIVTELISVERK